MVPPDGWCGPGFVPSQYCSWLSFHTSLILLVYLPFLLSQLILYLWLYFLFYLASVPSTMFLVFLAFSRSLLPSFHHGSPEISQSWSRRSFSLSTLNPWASECYWRNICDLSEALGHVLLYISKNYSPQPSFSLKPPCLTFLRRWPCPQLHRET